MASNVDRLRGLFAHEVDEAQLWTFREGLVVRLQAFPTIDEAYATARALDEAERIESAPPGG